MHGPDPQRWTRQASASPLSRDHEGTPFPTKTMICTAFVWVLVLLLFPVLLLLYATESRSTRIQRLHRNGHTYAEIAKRYRVSSTTVRRWANS